VFGFPFRSGGPVSAPQGFGLGPLAGDRPCLVAPWRLGTKSGAGIVFGLSFLFRGSLVMSGGLHWLVTSTAYLQWSLRRRSQSRTPHKNMHMYFTCMSYMCWVVLWRVLALAAQAKSWNLWHLFHIPLRWYACEHRVYYNKCMCLRVGMLWSWCLLSLRQRWAKVQNLAPSATRGRRSGLICLERASQSSRVFAILPALFQ